MFPPFFPHIFIIFQRKVFARSTTITPFGVSVPYPSGCHCPSTKRRPVFIYVHTQTRSSHMYLLLLLLFASESNSRTQCRPNVKSPGQLLGARGNHDVKSRTFYIYVPPPRSPTILIHHRHTPTHTHTITIMTYTQ